MEGVVLVWLYNCVLSFSLLLSFQAKSSGRVNRANQRKLASLYSAGDVSSDLAKYNQFKVQHNESPGFYFIIIISQRNQEEMLLYSLFPVPEEAVEVCQVHHSQLGVVCHGAHRCR